MCFNIFLKIKFLKIKVHKQTVSVVDSETGGQDLASSVCQNVGHPFSSSYLWQSIPNQLDYFLVDLSDYYLVGQLDPSLLNLLDVLLYLDQVKVLFLFFKPSYKEPTMYFQCFTSRSGMEKLCI